MQKLKDSFEKMDTYMECTRLHIHHFKRGFPYVSAKAFNEGEINMRTTNDKSDQAPSQKGQRENSLALFQKLKKSGRILGNQKNTETFFL